MDDEDHHHHAPSPRGIKRPSPDHRRLAHDLTLAKDQLKYALRDAEERSRDAAERLTFERTRVRELEEKVMAGAVEQVQAGERMKEAEKLRKLAEGRGARAEERATAAEERARVAEERAEKEKKRADEAQTKYEESERQLLEEDRLLSAEQIKANMAERRHNEAYAELEARYRQHVKNAHAEANKFQDRFTDLLAERNALEKKAYELEKDVEQTYKKYENLQRQIKFVNDLEACKMLIRIDRHQAKQFHEQGALAIQHPRGEFWPKIPVFETFQGEWFPVTKPEKLWSD